ncbi:MAG: hypothetical protein KF884_02395 [Fimbriimonadaceae bacterium]|nr:hypothetical protein [Fimbriimonadaceae bacterium]QYK58945.1 MAG: hypothetical protein KF884_02395 [Fimbriimonadaceae bacterium]
MRIVSDACVSRLADPVLSEADHDTACREPDPRRRQHEQGEWGHRPSK